MQEKRATARHSFGVEQMVAPMWGEEFPPSESFMTVRCIDISKDGFAFYQQDRPNYQQLVVALGLEPNITYLLARIAHFEMIELCGNLVFRVGCEFTGRARWSDNPKQVLQQYDPDAFNFLSQPT
jgi:hypothetical protein